MIKTLALCSAKGGAGKTTLAASLTVAAMQAGHRPFLIDLDPQGSLLSWGERRQAETPAVDRIAVGKLDPAIAGLGAAGYTLAIIDTPGIDTAATAAAMRLAALSLIPARPSMLDIEAAKPTLAALRLGRPFGFVLNSAPPGRSARVDDTARALFLLGVLATPPIEQRADHVDAIGSGLGVSEYAPDQQGGRRDWRALALDQSQDGEDAWQSIGRRLRRWRPASARCRRPTWSPGPVPGSRGRGRIARTSRST